MIPLITLNSEENQIDDKENYSTTNTKHLKRTDELYQSVNGKTQNIVTQSKFIFHFTVYNLT